MKLLLYVDEWAGRSVVRPDWGQMLLFSGKEPPPKSFIVLESKGIRGSSASAVIAWIESETGRSVTARDVVEIPESLWRKATLDDFIDARDAESAVWQVSEAFSVEELSAFLERWGPSVLEHARKALGEQEREPRARALERLAKRAERVLGPLGRLGQRAQKEREALLEQAELALVDEIGKSPVDLERSVDTFAKLQSWKAIFVMAQRLGEEIGKPERSDAEIAGWLEQLWNRQAARDHLRGAQPFWSALFAKRRLPPTVRGESVDITDAAEQKAVAGWELWRGRRVGRVIPGRSVLVIRGKDMQSTTFVRGERRLKHAAERAGGSLLRYGCTLEVRGAKERSVSRALLEVERIETLANVAPESLEERLRELGLPPSHLAYRALGRVREDPRQARILADLVIEYSLGIDADVARRLARDQSVGNRRR